MAMKSKMHVKKNDLVKVITGKDKGKEGRVIAVVSKKNKVMVQGVGMVTRHYKARKQGETSGLKQQETFIDVSNVKLINPA